MSEVVITILASALLGAFLEGLFTHVLEWRGFYDRIARFFLWKPYYRDTACLKAGLENCGSVFYLITGDGSFIENPEWGAVLKILKEKVRGASVEILFTGNHTKKGVREKIADLYKDGLTVRIVNLSEDGYKALQTNDVRALLSANSSDDVYIRTSLPKRKGEYIFRRFPERDLGKLVKCYFHITPKVVSAGKTTDGVNLKVQHPYTHVTEEV